MNPNFILILKPWSSIKILQIKLRANSHSTLLFTHEHRGGRFKSSQCHRCIIIILFFPSSKSLQLFVLSFICYSTGLVLFISVPYSKLHIPLGWCKIDNCQYHKRTNGVIAKCSTFGKNKVNIWNFSFDLKKVGH